MLLLLAMTTWARKAPTRPSIYGIAYVRIHSANLQASVPFFQKILGLIPDSGVCIQTVTWPANLRVSPPAEDTCKDSKLRGFYVSESQTIQLDPSAQPLPGTLLEEVGFFTSDVAAMRKFLLSQHLHPGPIEVYQRLSSVAVTDPEGHKIAFMERRGAYFIDMVSDPRVSKHVIHAGFVVRDRAAEEHFYKDVVGFRPYWHGGMKDDQTDWVSMQVPDGTDWLEFMVNVSPNANKKELGVMNHIALGVPDIHAVEKQLRAKGWTGTEEPKIGRGGKWQLNLYDPDDTRIELMEFTPVQKPCCSEFTGSHPKP